MDGIEGARAVARLLEQCAEQRTGGTPPWVYDDPERLAQLLQAEAAGRALLCALLRPATDLELGLGALLRRLVGYLQTVVQRSTPAVECPPLLTVQAHQVVLDAAAAQLLRDAALLLTLAALDDGARQVELRLAAQAGGVGLVVESDRPWAPAPTPALAALRAAVAGRGGSWTLRGAPHGASWLVQVVVPSLSYEECAYAA